MKAAHRSITFLLIAVIVCSLTVHPYTQADIPDQYDLPQITYLGLDNGLPGRHVFNVEEDSEGFLWILVQEGLFRYDGYEYVNLKSIISNPEIYPNGSFRQLTIMPNGDLWIIVDREMVHFDKESNSISKSNLEFQVGAAPSIAHDKDAIITQEFLDDNIALALIKRDTAIIIDTIWSRQQVVATKSIIKDIEQKIWVSSLSGDIKQYDSDLNLNNTFRINNELLPHVYPLFPSVALGPQKNVYAIGYENPMIVANHTTSDTVRLDFATDRLSSIKYLATLKELKPNEVIQTRAHIFKWNHKGNKWSEQISFDQNITSMFHLFVDSQNDYWLFGNEELYKVESGLSFNLTSELKAIKSFTLITGIYEDSKKNIWITTDNGIFNFSNKRQAFQKKLNESNKDWAKTFRGFMESSDGEIYARCENCGTTLNNGIFVLSEDKEPKTISHFKSKHSSNKRLLGWTQHFIKGAEEDIFWSSGLRRLFRFNLENEEVSEYQIRESFKKNTYSDLSLYADDQLIIGYSLDQLYIFDIPTQSLKRIQLTIDLVDSGIHSLKVTRDKKLWVGLQYLGLMEIDVENEEIINHYHAGSEIKLPENSILQIHEDSAGVLWLATGRSGLVMFDRDNQKVKVYNTQSGLSNDKVVSIEPWKDEYLWIGTYNGLNCFHIPTETIVKYYDKDGLTHNEFNYTSHFKDSKGRLYFGGMNGFNVFYPDSLNSSNDVNTLILTELKTYDQEEDVLVTQYQDLSEMKQLVLEPSKTWFEFSYSIDNFKQTESNQFRTWLKGLENDWTLQGSNHRIRYNKLPAGKYDLHIQGADSKGNWSKSKVIAIEVQQVFYKSLWFLILCFISAIGIIYGIFRYRFLQKLKFHQMRLQISSDLHDEVGSSLAHLSMLMKSINGADSQTSMKYFEKGNELLGNVMNRIRDIVWAIDGRNDESQYLVDRMEDFAYDMLPQKQIKFELHTKELNPKTVLPPILRQNVYLIYKEAITNIIKHSNADKVWITIAIRDKQIILSIKDNGSPKESKKESGSGLTNMELRAKRIRGVIDILKNNEGFSIYLKAPLS